MTIKRRKREFDEEERALIADSRIATEEFFNGYIRSIKRNSNDVNPNHIVRLSNEDYRNLPILFSRIDPVGVGLDIDRTLEVLNYQENHPTHTRIIRKMWYDCLVDTSNTFYANTGVLTRTRRRILNDRMGLHVDGSSGSGISFTEDNHPSGLPDFMLDIIGGLKAQVSNWDANVSELLRRAPDAVNLATRAMIRDFTSNTMNNDFLDPFVSELKALRKRLRPNS